MIAPSATAPAFRNGRHLTKGSGDNIFRGTLSQLPPPVPVTSIEEAAEAMFTDGCVQFPDLLSPAEVARMRDWMDRSGGPDSQYEVKDWCFNKHINADFQHQRNWLELIDRSPAYEVLEMVMGEAFGVVGGSLWVTGRGRAMGIHLDHLAIALPEEMLADPRVRVPVYSCTLHYYLDDQVEEIGPTLLIPGSHRAGHAPHNEPTWNGREPQMISVKAGGAVLFRHDLWHGAAMNSSTRKRYMIQVHYGDRTKHRFYPPITTKDAFDPEILAAATPRQRQLLGEAPSGIFY